MKCNTVQFLFNRDAEQSWAVTHFAQLIMQVAQHCVAERFGSEISPSLNGIVFNRDAEQSWAMTHFAQLIMHVAQYCVAERFGSE